jgi:hypothetical protein
MLGPVIAASCPQAISDFAASLRPLRLPHALWAVSDPKFALPHALRAVSDFAAGIPPNHCLDSRTIRMPTEEPCNWLPMPFSLCLPFRFLARHPTEILGCGRRGIEWYGNWLDKRSTIQFVRTTIADELSCSLPRRRSTRVLRDPRLFAICWAVRCRKTSVLFGWRCSLLAKRDC